MTKILIDEAVVRFVMDAIDGFFAAPDDEADQEAQDELLTARSKLRQALAEAALDKKAENARELGLDYEQPAPAQEPVADHECRRLLYGFMLDCNAVGLDQAGKNLHKGMKQAAHGITKGNT